MWRSRPEQLGQVSAGAWLADRDLDERARQFMEMLLRTTSYVADFDAISADAALSNTKLGLWPGALYLDGGWGQLVKGLARAGRQRGVGFQHARATAVEPDGGRVVVRTDGDFVVCRRVVLAAGSPGACAALLRERPAAWGAVGSASTVACLDLGLDRRPDVGALLSLDRPLYLGRHCPPADLAPPGASVVHVVRYLRPDEELPAGEARDELAAHARLAGIDPDDAEEQRYLHHMVACSALPHPSAGGLRGRPSVQSGIDGVFVAGDWVGPVGHLADAALASGAAAGVAAATQPTVRTMPVGS